MRSPQHMHRARNRGFSLIEVLAAVAVLAFVYIALAEYAMRGLSAEGEAQRRLHAATLADTKLAELESQFLLHAYPKIGTQESDEDAFHVTIEVRAFPVELPPWTPKAEVGGTPSASAPEGPSFLRAHEEDKEAPLRTILIRIEWPEGRSLQSVSRTTIFFDQAAHTELLDSLPVRLAGKDASKSTDEDSEDDSTEEDDDTELDFDWEGE